MLIGNINYPMAHFRLHRDEDCPYIRRRRHHARRLIEINGQNRDAQLAHLASEPFGSAKGVNQMWIEVDLQDPPLEARVLDEVRASLVRRYGWLEKADWVLCQRCG